MLMFGRSASCILARRALRINSSPHARLIVLAANWSEAIAFCSAHGKQRPAHLGSVPFSWLAICYAGVSVLVTLAPSFTRRLGRHSALLSTMKHHPRLWGAHHGHEAVEHAQVANKRIDRLRRYAGQIALGRECLYCSESTSLCDRKSACERYHCIHPLSAKPAPCQVRVARTGRSPRSQEDLAAPRRLVDLRPLIARSGSSQHSTAVQRSLVPTSRTTSHASVRRAGALTPTGAASHALQTQDNLSAHHEQAETAPGGGWFASWSWAGRTWRGGCRLRALPAQQSGAWGSHSWGRNHRASTRCSGRFDAGRSRSNPCRRVRRGSSLCGRVSAPLFNI
ncbi:hypothetical protein BV25DRAFT_1291821 [Artomyces pyxidatus]|uniref:Uncharacterized protein n=1 Tax=Artomyces pyxidatus TaxID=48021 RepID=A0ACB8SP59_9AGAM|nr:hypothetical protein BV25DRAFT_1291821 [Artomyces pyxidatus]